MLRVAGLAVAVLFGALPAMAGAEPPPVTWDWYRAGEVYKRYPNATRNDLLIAARYHRRAAEKGNAASAYKLAEMYENGVGVGRDLAAALHWYRAAAEIGDPHGQVRLGWFLQEGLGTEPDVMAAVQWYERAAAQDNVWAYHMLAVLYAEGKGVAADPVRARLLFERSVPHTGDGWAKWRLGTLVVDTQPRRARRLFREAADAGIAQAAEELRSRGW